MEKLNTHQEKKKGLIESLTVRLRATHELLHKAEELSTLTSEKAIDAIDTLLTELPFSFPEKIRDKKSELAVLRQEYTDVSEELEPTADFDTADFNVANFTLDNELKSKLGAVLNKIEQVIEEPDIVYLETVEEGLRHLREKAQGVATNSSDERLNRPGTIHKYTDAFSIVAIIKESEWAIENANGFHIQNSPNIYIRESVFNNDDKYPITLAHERVHNILDGIETHDPINPAEQISYKINQIKRMIQLKAPEATLENELAKVTTPRYLDILLDGTRNELLAYWDSHENTALDTQSVEELPDFKISMLSTAGKQLQETIAILKKLPTEFSKLEHPNIAATFDHLHHNFEDKVIGMIHLTRNQSRKAAALGTEAEADRRALMYLLPPSKYRHIDTYLDSTYGIAPASDD